MKFHFKLDGESNWTWILCGIILNVFSCSILIVFEPLFDYILKTVLVFNSNSLLYDEWKLNKEPFIADIYLFNWTNPEELENYENVKPKFQEIGPYRFREYREKTNIVWNENDTVTYEFKQHYFYDADNSPKDLNDLVNIINIVPLSIAYRARHFAYVQKRMISYVLSMLSPLYVRKTAGELLFQGYKDIIVNFLHKIPSLDIKDKFGLFYGMNGTKKMNGVLNIWTSNDENFGKLAFRNYDDKVKSFDGRCGKIRGSSGEFYPMNRERTFIEVAAQELCKPSKFAYEKDVTFKTVNGYKFSGKDAFDNGTKLIENKCACDYSDECYPSGVLDFSTCAQGAPAFLSMPHFYNADPYYRNGIEGMAPNSNHEMFITLEPKTGLPLQMAGRLQLNVLLQPIEGITMYRKVPKIFVPICYIDEVVPIPDRGIFYMKLVQTMPFVKNILVAVFIFIGSTLIIWKTVYCTRNEVRKRKWTKYNIICNEKLYTHGI